MVIWYRETSTTYHRKKCRVDGIFQVFSTKTPQSCSETGLLRNSLSLLSCQLAACYFILNLKCCHLMSLSSFWIQPALSCWLHSSEFSGAKLT